MKFTSDVAFCANVIDFVPLYVALEGVMVGMLGIMLSTLSVADAALAKAALPAESVAVFAATVMPTVPLPVKLFN